MLALVSDEPPPPKPSRPPLPMVAGNPKGSFYDQGLQLPPPPPITPESRESTDADGKAGYRQPLIGPPRIEPPRVPEIMANPKGSYYDRGLARHAGWRRRPWLLFLLVVAAGVAVAVLLLRR